MLTRVEKKQLLKAIQNGSLTIDEIKEQLPAPCVAALLGEDNLLVGNSVSGEEFNGKKLV